MKVRTLWALAVVTAAIVAVATWQLRDKSESESRENWHLLPGLPERVNDVGIIEIRTPDQTFSVVRENDGWIVPERYNFPANRNVVRSFVIGLSELKRLEPKTSNPRFYSELQVEDITRVGAKSLLVTLQDHSGQPLARLIIGKVRPAKWDPARTELYVRLADHAESWLVEGKVAVRRSAQDWLARDLLNIDRSRIQRARLDHADSEDVTISRTAATEPDFTLHDVPPGYQIQHAFAVNDVAYVWASLTLEDVILSRALAANEPLTTATMETFDGLRVTAQVKQVDGVNYALMSADAIARTPASNETPGTVGPGKDTAEEAQKLMRQWQGWAYRLSDVTFENLTKRKSDLMTIEQKSGADQPSSND